MCSFVGHPLENRFSHVVSATGQTVNRYSDLSSVFGSALCQSGRPRHSLHGKPAVFTAATSRFTAIMSQLSYHTRGNSKLQELFLYLSTNIFGKFHDSAVCELSCRALQFYRIFAELSTAAVWISCARNDIPCLSLRFQGRGSAELRKTYFPALEKSLQTGYIIPRLGCLQPR